MGSDATSESGDSAAPPPKGAILAVDYGTKRIGLAVTDSDRHFVFPRDTLQRSTLAADLDHLRAVIQDDRIALIVIGFPLNANGSEGPMAKAVRAFQDLLSKELQKPVRLFDERYTSLEAEERLREQYPKDTRKRRALRDRAAASIILKGYLEHLRGGPERSNPQDRDF